MSKRDLFEELKSGLEDAKLYEQQKLTLKTTAVIPKNIHYFQLTRYVQ